MADWETTQLDNTLSNGFSNHRRQTPDGSCHSDKINRNSSHVAYQSDGGNSSLTDLLIKGGTELADESKTDLSPTHVKDKSLQMSDVPPKQPITQSHGSESGSAKVKAAKIPQKPSINLIPAENLTIPSDANISSFTCNQLSTFLKCLKVEDRIISHLLQKSVDGKRFSKMKDLELNSLGMNNPVIVFFRNKSSVKVKATGPFML